MDYLRLQTMWRIASKVHRTINNGSIVIPVNGTCIEEALSFDNMHLQGKQQVGSSPFQGISYNDAGVLQIPTLGDVWAVGGAFLGRRLCSFEPVAKLTDAVPLLLDYSAALQVKGTSTESD